MEVGNTHLLFCNHDCAVKMCINIILKENMYYETNYSYFPKHEKCESCNSCNPFNQLDQLDETSKEGEIIVKNSMTTEMISNLLKSKKELEKEIGNTDGNEYKKRILWCITHLWD